MIVWSGRKKREIRRFRTMTINHTTAVQGFTRAKGTDDYKNPDDSGWQDSVLFAVHGNARQRLCSNQKKKKLEGATITRWKCADTRALRLSVCTYILCSSLYISLFFRSATCCSGIVLNIWTDYFQGYCFQLNYRLK